MKVLYLTDQLYLHGGIEKVLSQKANYLAEKYEFEVTVLTTEQKGNPLVYPFSNLIRFVDLGVDYDRNRSYSSLSNLRKVPVHYLRLKKEIRKIQPDIIVSASFGPDYYFLNQAASGIPVIKEYHSSRALRPAVQKGYTKRLLRKLEDRCEQNFTKIVLLNEDERAFYKSENIAVIPNPADIIEQSSAARQRIVLAAGRISPVKNFVELIDIWHKVATDFPDWQLHIYGEDYVGTQARLENKVHKLRLQKSVKFMGASPEMRKIMNESSVFALTSKTECFSMVLIEALSAGIPVVSYDCPTGPRHIVTHESDGLLVTPGDRAAFGDALIRLMSDVGLREDYGKAGIKNIGRFSIEKVMKQWHDLFLSLKHG